MSKKIEPEIILDVVLTDIIRQLAQEYPNPLQQAQKAADMWLMVQSFKEALKDVQARAEAVLKIYLDSTEAHAITLDGVTIGYREGQTDLVDQAVWEEICKKNITARDAQARKEELERTLEAAKRRLEAVQKRFLARYIVAEPEFFIEVKK